MTVGHCWRCGAYGTLKDYCGQWLCEHCLGHPGSTGRVVEGSDSLQTGLRVVHGRLNGELRLLARAISGLGTVCTAGGVGTGPWEVPAEGNQTSAAGCNVGGGGPDHRPPGDLAAASRYSALRRPELLERDGVDFAPPT